MIFSEYIIKMNKSIKKVSEELETSYQNILRYYNQEVIPRKEMMLKIEKWSRGKVKANDFYKQKVDE